MSAPVERCVNGFASPPSIDSKYTCESPLRDDKNAIIFPSGDHTGDESCPLCVSCNAVPPVVGTIQILLAPRFASISGVDTVYATHLPSGDTCASPSLCIWIMSSNVMACFPGSCAITRDCPANGTTRNKLHRRMARFIAFPPAFPSNDVRWVAFPLRGTLDDVTIPLRFQARSRAPSFSWWQPGAPSFSQFRRAGQAFRRFVPDVDIVRHRGNQPGKSEKNLHS